LCLFHFICRLFVRRDVSVSALVNVRLLTFHQIEILPDELFKLNLEELHLAFNSIKYRTISSSTKLLPTA
jgi:hypothetical protein